MKKVKEAVNECVAPVAKLMELIGTDKEMPALDVLAVCKQVESLITAIKETLVPDANKEYAALKEKNPGLNVLDILGGEASVSRYSPRGIWIYSPYLVQKEAELKSDMKLEQENGKAKKITNKGVTDYQATYAITLKAIPEPVKA